MHILILPSEYPTEDHKLGGIFVKEQISYLKKNHKIGVIYIYLFSIKKILKLLSNIFSRQKKLKQKYFFYWPRIPKLKYLNFLSHYFFCEIFFRRYIKNHGMPEIIHVHFSEFAGYSAYKLFKKYKIPYVITEHSTDYLDGKIEQKYKMQSKKYLLLKKIITSASKIITVSNFLNKKVKNFFKLKENKIITIPNASLLIKKKNTRKVFDFIFVGTLESRKNPIQLLRVFNSLYNRGNMKLAMIGDGPLLNQCKDFIKNKKLQKNVKIFSKLNRYQVLNLVNKSKALVSTSLHETFGIVSIEALSLGVPIISFNNGGVLDIINKKNGILVKDRSDLTLKKSLELFFLNHSKFNKNEIIKFYKKKFFPRIVINKINKVYNSVGLY